MFTSRRDPVHLPLATKTTSPPFATETTRTRVTTCQPVRELSIEDVQLLTVISQAAWLNVEGETQPKTSKSFEQFDADFQAAQEKGDAARRNRLGLEKNDSSESHQDGNTTSSTTEPDYGAAINGIDTVTADENTMPTPIAPPPAPRPARALLAPYEPVPIPSAQTLPRELEERVAALCGYHVVMK
jgi:hypothetical protein